MGNRAICCQEIKRDRGGDVTANTTSKTKPIKKIKEKNNKPHTNHHRAVGRPPKKKIKKASCLVSYKILGDDIWLMISEYLVGHVQWATLLGMCNRYFRRVLLNNVCWWTSFYHKVILYQKIQFKQSRYLKKIRQLEHIMHVAPHISAPLSACSPHPLTCNTPKKILTLVFGCRCQFCGKTSDHFLVKSLLIRTCQDCFADNLIGNGVLYFQYGLSFYDFLEKYAACNGILIPTNCALDAFYKKKCLLTQHDCQKLHTLKQRVQSILCMDDTSAAKRVLCHSNQGSDLEDREPFSWCAPRYLETENRECCFLWKSDIERILNTKLEDCQEIQATRIKAARVLTAACARLALTQLPSTATSYFKIPLPRTWVPGGPFFSYFDVASSPRRLTDFWWRPGFDMEKFDFINQVILRRYKHRLLLRLKQ